MTIDMRISLRSGTKCTKAKIEEGESRRKQRPRKLSKCLGADAIRIGRRCGAKERDDGLVREGTVAAANQELGAVVHGDHARVERHVLAVIEDEAAVDVNAFQKKVRRTPSEAEKERGNKIPPS